MSLGGQSLDEVYDRQFFSEYGVQNPVYARCCALIAQEIARRFSPQSVVDWGCGAGLHAATLQELGIATLAVDGSTPCPELCAPGIERVRADLRLPVPPGLVPQRYDLSLCLDVLEHIDDMHLPQVLATITQGAQLLLLSCAPPGQGGHHHVNEQPRRYWVARLAAIGWRYERRETGALERFFRARRADLPLSWMYHNLCVYRL